MGHGYQIAIFHCHQAVEKFLKAILNEQGKHIPKIHDLIKLATLTQIEIPKQIIHMIQDLNPHYMPPRYYVCLKKSLTN